jgi:hypothetical protein
MTNTGPESGQSKLSLADEAAFRVMCGDELASRRLYMLNNGYVPLPAEDKGVYLPNWSNLDADGTQRGIQPTIEDIDRVEQHVGTLWRGRRYRLRRVR